MYVTATPHYRLQRDWSSVGALQEDNVSIPLYPHKLGRFNLESCGVIISVKRSFEHAVRLHQNRAVVPTSGSGTEMHSTCSDFDKGHILQVGMECRNVHSRLEAKLKISILPQSCCQNGPLVSHKTAADSAGRAAPPVRANMKSSLEGYTLARCGIIMG